MGKSERVEGQECLHSAGGPTGYLCSATILPMGLMFIGLCIIAIVEELETNLMSLAILFHLLCAQHVSDIHISIFRSLRLC